MVDEAMPSHRQYEPLTTHDLQQLRNIALEEHLDFFRRNRHLAHAYKEGLIAICLCQGAASHFLNPSVGIKDFDIWHFYRDDDNVPFPYRARKRISEGYQGSPVDFLKRAVPQATAHHTDPSDTLMSYLCERNTRTKRELLNKAIIGLYPDAIFARVLWEGTF